MKRCILALLALLAIATTACASDSIAVGARAGAAAGESSYSTEVFGDLYLNRLVSIGATLGYTMIDKDNKRTFSRDESVPITALFKVHAPIPFVKPYAGLGQALIFHDKRGTKGSVIGLAGLNFPIGPIFLNAEYRRQFDDKLDILAGGVGISF
ncbi:MAG: hypothetical protein A2X82_14645 [Geobacteraceae bacterium GWC2_55_20]|nr:MAG: hypothetical protein A2X82_14645 [Geobacteraceae bacterium GWC2_55_20]OGU21356.1 MAG: hypothetical protein A2X85_08210 [Geobacteraceae bacterium GWF2_54_21]HBA71456.1 hypothetical protein [Geobacter sp.]HCE69230.1 hypothetical protein [Geobacter sp.]